MDRRVLQTEYKSGSGLMGECGFLEAHTTLPESRVPRANVEEEKRSSPWYASLTWIVSLTQSLELAASGAWLGCFLQRISASFCKEFSSLFFASSVRRSLLPRLSDVDRSYIGCWHMPYGKWVAGLSECLLREAVVYVVRSLALSVFATLSVIG